MLKDRYLNLFDLILAEVNIKEIRMENYTYGYLLNEAERDAFCNAPRGAGGGHFDRLGADAWCSDLLWKQMEYVEDVEQKRKRLSTENEPRKKPKT